MQIDLVDHITIVIFDTLYVGNITVSFLYVSFLQLSSSLPRGFRPKLI
jgi:hypothetical protein